jgi:hypothetical protein
MVGVVAAYLASSRNGKNGIILLAVDRCEAFYGVLYAFAQRCVRAVKNGYSGVIFSQKCIYIFHFCYILFIKVIVFFFIISFCFRVYNNFNIKKYFKLYEK